MRTFKSSGLLVLAAVTALAGSSLSAVGLMPGQASSLTTSASTAATTPVSAGTLTLRTTSTQGIVEFAGQSQEFREGTQCSIVQDSGEPDLLKLEGFVGSGSSGGAAGFRNGDIGVFEPNLMSDPNNAAQCFRVDDGSFIGVETLALRLGADVADEFGELVATQITVSAFRSSKSGTISVQLVQPDGTVLTPDPVRWSGGKPDSKISIPAYSGTFTEIRLTATAGSFSLRGAEFDLASGADATFCADGQAGGSYTNDEGVTVVHLGNADGTACTAFSIRLGSDAEAKVWFTKPLDVDPEAQFIFTVPWDPTPLPEPTAPATLPLGSELPEAFIDFELPTPVDRRIDYCPDYLFGSSGKLVGMPPVGSPGYAAARSDLESRDMEPPQEGVIQTVGIQYACIGDRDATVQKSTTGSGYVANITDLIYLIGDARMSLK